MPPVAPMSRPQLVVLLKEPHPGRVKTRLGKEIGMTEAAWWFRHQAIRLIRRLDDPRWNLILSVSPDREGMKSRIWPIHLPRIPQGRGDLGQRMGLIMRSLPPGPVAIIGSDVPGIQPRHVARAFRALGSRDAVFGPAPDGGFWLIGLKRAAPPPATLFDGVRWSSRHALSDTMASLPGCRAALVDTLLDVDTAADLSA